MYIQALTPIQITRKLAEQMQQRTTDNVGQTSGDGS
jgi:hypothetical protein